MCSLYNRFGSYGCLMVFGWLESWFFTRGCLAFAVMCLVLSLKCIWVQAHNGMAISNAMRLWSNVLYVSDVLSRGPVFFCHHALGFHTPFKRDSYLVILYLTVVKWLMSLMHCCIGWRNAASYSAAFMYLAPISMSVDTVHGLDDSTLIWCWGLLLLGSEKSCGRRRSFSGAAIICGQIARRSGGPNSAAHQNKVRHAKIR